MNINKSNTSPTHIMINRDEIELWLKNSDYLAELSKYIELPSRTGNKEEVLKCSKFALELLNSCGLETKVFPS
ncbi:MAG: hypothetical protein OEZ01_05990, partial [Candidatus Heimdallarchaeota archaeon]|nr:hypothetical protein [Candidatus Heimdallarchaeota archaeon]